jgi:hypothetical protein
MAGFFAHGTVTKINSIAVAGVTNITPLDRTRGEIQTTDSQSQYTHEFIPGLRNFGGVTVDFNIITGDAGQSEIIDSYEASDADDAVVEVSVELPNGTTVIFDAFVTALTWALPQDSDEKATGSVTFKVSKDQTTSLST